MSDPDIEHRPRTVNYESIFLKLSFAAFDDIFDRL